MAQVQDPQPDSERPSAKGPTTEPQTQRSGSPLGINRWALGALIVASLWAYWPTLLSLAEVWEREPDYSHGFLVLPLFIAFLFLRSDTFPKSIKPSWLGLIAIGGSIALRFAGAKYFITPFDGWSIVLWVIGATLCLGGWSLLRWSLAPTLFLFFMVPLPFRAETLISQPLQKIAANLSAFCLRCIGQPAFVEETTILIGSRVLEVEQSCSGLRIFVGIFALACGYLIAFRRELWESALLLLSAIPVALLANAVRIVVTAILFQHFTEEAAHKFSHDVAGWLMIPLAAAMLGAVQWYLNCLMQDVAAGNIGETLRRDAPVTNQSVA